MDCSVPPSLSNASPYREDGAGLAPAPGALPAGEGKFARPVRAAILLMGGGGLWAAICAAIWAR